MVKTTRNAMRDLNALTDVAAATEKLPSVIAMLGQIGQA
jgi:hypothetical protein